MNDNDAGGIILVLFILTVMNMIGFGFRTWDRYIESGDQFILRKASYKCIKTNELVGPK